MLTGSDGSELGLSKFVPHRNNNAEYTKDEYSHKIGDFWHGTTIEAVVEPRNK
jgi:hypothetical protein